MPKTLINPQEVCIRKHSLSTSRCGKTGGVGRQNVNFHDSTCVPEKMCCNSDKFACGAIVFFHQSIKFPRRTVGWPRGLPTAAGVLGGFLQASALGPRNFCRFRRCVARSKSGANYVAAQHGGCGAPRAYAPRWSFRPARAPRDKMSCSHVVRARCAAASATRFLARPGGPRRSGPPRSSPIPSGAQSSLSILPRGTEKRC